MERTSESGLPIDPVREDSKPTDFRPDDELGQHGKYPHPRGVYPSLREQRDQATFGRAQSAAEGTQSTGDPLRADVTVGEACDALRDVWGGYQPERI
jgi:hypothetical protein